MSEKRDKSPKRSPKRNSPTMDPGEFRKIKSQLDTIEAKEIILKTKINKLTQDELKLMKIVREA